MEHIRSFSRRQEIERKNKDIGKFIGKYDGKRAEDLPDSLKERIDTSILYINWNYEFMRLMMIWEDHAKMLLGFSPNVTIRNMARCGVDSDDFPDGYPYLFNDGNQVWCFGDWASDQISITDYIDFFSTPEFLIEYEDDQNKINIKIRDYQKVAKNILTRFIVFSFRICFEKPFFIILGFSVRTVPFSSPKSRSYSIRVDFRIQYA